MEYLQKVREALVFLEENLREPIALEDVAAHAGFSPFHFHRLFSAVVGESVKSYLRKRRFAKATDDLIHTDKRILDIAIEYGFESQESFTRSFKQKLGITPGRYRKNGRHYALYLPAELAASSLETIQGGMEMSNNVMEAKIEKKPEFQMIGLQLSRLDVNACPDEEQKRNAIPNLWGAFMQRIGEIQNRTDLSTSYGVCVPTGGTEFTYMCAVEVTSFDEVPEGMVTYTVPAQQYALFTHKGPASTIPEATKHIYGEWLPQTGYETFLAPELEVYDQRYCGPMSAESVMEIWVPIK